MPNEAIALVKPTKGKLTAERILDAAEQLFSTQGYEGTSLRQIAKLAEIQEPGLYNHFSGKQALYEAVLDRALTPMSSALDKHLESATGLRDYIDIPSLITDLLVERPQNAKLLHQAMHGDAATSGNEIVHNCLDSLFNKGVMNLDGFAESPDSKRDRDALAINVIALFNLTIGYFLSQQSFDTMADGNILDPEKIAKQKRMLHRVIRAMLIS